MSFSVSQKTMGEVILYGTPCLQSGLLLSVSSHMEGNLNMPGIKQSIGLLWQIVLTPNLQ